ncbi:GNAT family N-acetyltransferase [Mesorhizobium sp. YR577]|uniref:GNAT family N-acetyltransferase n=1 Tax=Mesorhizobium sp. YR577 TaxID=1884373 RepID=UPI0008E3C237|nr:GNAT family N-acetyltransferase [Mesorhizobium sp. YR577]SFU00245.1 Acetyltransferase (GNAT) domain-containing protein [Mesorhizobium sp. YR577]
MNFTWIEHFGGDRERELFELYRQEWWTRDRSFDDVAHMLKHSAIVLGCCTDDDRLIGFARVLTDFTFKAMIFDVIVHADFRGSGVGKAIVDRIIGLPSLARVSSFELYCPERLVPFYEKLGFAEGSAKLLFHQR